MPTDSSNAIVLGDQNTTSLVSAFFNYVIVATIGSRAPLPRRIGMAYRPGMQRVEDRVLDVFALKLCKSSAVNLTIPRQRGAADLVSCVFIHL